MTESGCRRTDWSRCHRAGCRRRRCAPWAGNQDRADGDTGPLRPLDGRVRGLMTIKRLRLRKERSKSPSANMGNAEASSAESTSMSFRCVNRHRVGLPDRCRARRWRTAGPRIARHRWDRESRSPQVRRLRVRSSERTPPERALGSAGTCAGLVTLYPGGHPEIAFAINGEQMVGLPRQLPLDALAVIHQDEAAVLEREDDIAVAQQHRAV